MLTVSQLPPSEQVAFIRKTYLHLAAAFAAFVGVSFFLCATGIAMLLVLELRPNPLDLVWGVLDHNSQVVVGGSK
ncbi:hypothetical protein [Trichothermofontia sp.]